jgi:hypothetical protein
MLLTKLYMNYGARQGKARGDGKREKRETEKSPFSLHPVPGHQLNVGHFSTAETQSHRDFLRVLCVFAVQSSVVWYWL